VKKNGRFDAHAPDRRCNQNQESAALADFGRFDKRLEQAGVDVPPLSSIVKEQAYNVNH